jgi:hypothetical protein
MLIDCNIENIRLVQIFISFSVQTMLCFLHSLVDLAGFGSGLPWQAFVRGRVDADLVVGAPVNHDSHSEFLVSV